MGTLNVLDNAILLYSIIKYCFRILDYTELDNTTLMQY